MATWQKLCETANAAELNAEEKARVRLNLDSHEQPPIYGDFVCLNPPLVRCFPDRTKLNRPCVHSDDRVLLSVFTVFLHGLQMEWSSQGTRLV